MKSIRRLYDWMLHWAETPYGPLVLFALAFFESFIFPIPPDALLIALVLGARTQAFKLALNSSIGSVLGALVGYGIGHILWWNSPNEFSSKVFFAVFSADNASSLP